MTRGRLVKKQRLLVPRCSGRVLDQWVQLQGPRVDQVYALSVASDKEWPLGGMVARHHGYTAADLILDLLVLNEDRALEAFIFLLECVADVLRLLEEDEAWLVEAQDVLALFVFEDDRDEHAFGELERVWKCPDKLEDFFFGAT